MQAGEREKEGCRAGVKPYNRPPMPRVHTTSGFALIAITLMAALIASSMQAFFFPFLPNLEADASVNPKVQAVPRSAEDRPDKLAGSDTADKPTDPDEDRGGWNDARPIDFWIRWKSNPSGGSVGLVALLRWAPAKLAFRRPHRCGHVAPAGDAWTPPLGSQCRDPNHPCHAPPFYLPNKASA